jgi:DNA polymerase-3 subunit delta'
VKQRCPAEVCSERRRRWAARRAGSSREEAEATLALLTVWVRDVAVARAGGEGLFHPELRVLAEKVAARLDDDSLHRRFRLLDDAMVAIRQRNASPRLQLERMLLEMEG